MQHIFYFFSVLFIIVEATTLVNTEDYVRFKKKLKTLKSDEMEPKHTAFVLLQLCYFIWAATGLMSSQWIPFLVLILYSFIPKGDNIFIRKADAILSLAILLFIVINKYHLGINLLDYIK